MFIYAGRYISYKIKAALLDINSFIGYNKIKFITNLPLRYKGNFILFGNGERHEFQ